MYKSRLSKIEKALVAEKEPFKVFVGTNHTSFEELHQEYWARCSNPAELIIDVINRYE